jgi:hypothetical protein
MTQPTTRPKRNFTWGIKSSDIRFTRLNAGDALLDGSGGCDGCGNCGCGSARVNTKDKVQSKKRASR